MVLKNQNFSYHIFITIVFLINYGMLAYGNDSDIFCLRSIKDSLQDPYNYLKSWNFNHKSEGFICGFIGVDCWNALENRVLSLSLSGMGLKGKFPLGIQNCTSLTGLDLSNNILSGAIPGNIDTILPYVTFLDLSSNNFSGVIPVSLANCTYVNSIKLDQNQLSGQIPPQLSLLQRIKIFSVSNNVLTGPIPKFDHQVSVNYTNNKGLCGAPLKPCHA